MNGPVPETTTLNAAVLPAITVWLVGCVVMVCADKIVVPVASVANTGRMLFMIMGFTFCFAVRTPAYSILVKPMNGL